VHFGLKGGKYKIVTTEIITIGDLKELLMVPTSMQHLLQKNRSFFLCILLGVKHNYLKTTIIVTHWSMISLLKVSNSMQQLVLITAFPTIIINHFGLLTFTINKHKAL